MQASSTEQAGLTHWEKILKIPGYAARVDMLFGLSPKIGQGFGLEVSPLFCPMIDSEQFSVDYCDYLSYEDLHEREKNHPVRIDYDLKVQKLNFIWPPGKRLVDVAPKLNGTGKKYDYIVSSHVLEHVPDFLGYLENMNEVLNDGGVIAFYLPSALGSPEVFRPLSSVGNVLDAYINCTSQPTFSAIYDYYRMSIDASAPFKGGCLSDYSRPHSLDTAVRDAFRGAISYVDAHCWVFTPESFRDIIAELRALGVFNYDILAMKESAPTPYGRGYEFCVVLEKRVPPEGIVSETAISLRNARTAQGQKNQGAANLSSVAQEGYEVLLRSRGKDIKHGELAFHEAVAVQEQLKQELAAVRAHGELAFQEAVALQEQLKQELAATKAHGERAFQEAVAVQERLQQELTETKTHRELASQEAKLLQVPQSAGFLGKLSRVVQRIFGRGF